MKAQVDFFSWRFVGYTILWGGMFLATIGFIRMTFTYPFIFLAGAACLVLTTHEKVLRDLLREQRWIIAPLAVAVVGVGFTFLMRGDLRFIVAFCAGIGVAGLIVLYSSLYFREGRPMAVYLGFIGYFGAFTLWVFYVISFFGTDTLMRVGLGGQVERGLGGIGAESLAVWGLFRIPNLLNWLYFLAPVAGLLAWLVYRNQWWLKAIACALLVLSLYLSITLSSRGPILITVLAIALVFGLTLRRNFLLGAFGATAVAALAYLVVRRVDPLLVSNLIGRFERADEDARIMLMAAGLRVLFQGPFSSVGAMMEGYSAHNLIIDYGLHFNIVVSLGLLGLLIINFFISLRWVRAFLRGQAPREALFPLAVNLGAVTAAMIQPNLQATLLMWIISAGMLTTLWSLRMERRPAPGVPQAAQHRGAPPAQRLPLPHGRRPPSARPGPAPVPAFRRAFPRPPG